MAVAKTPRLERQSGELLGRNATGIFRTWKPRAVAVPGEFDQNHTCVKTDFEVSQGCSLPTVISVKSK